VDALGAFLDGPRARGAFLLRTVWSPPWALRVEDDAPLTLVAMLRGDAWITPDGAEPVHLAEADVAVVQGTLHYAVGDDPRTPPRALILPGGRCAPVDDRTKPYDLGLRSWGSDQDGSTTMLVGTYLDRGEVSRRLLDALPPLLRLPGADIDPPLVGLLAAEMARDEPGQDAVLDRLLDLLLIAVLRTWFTLQGDRGPAWYRGHRDPLVGAALRALHAEPARPWTVASLAAAVGVSRAALARRFTEVVGEPPMGYLAAWRLAMAADLLREPDATLAGVARRVGYGTPYALSSAFKRVRGTSPSEYRRATARTAG
jgi:AraC-like DNA-binding protein